MNQCSFQIKGWMIAIVTALIAAYVATISKNNPSGNKLFLFLAAFPTALFWFLDSMYLSKERKLIGIYNDVAKVSDPRLRRAVKVYDMPLHRYKKGKYSFFKALIAPSEIVLYGSIIAGMILLGIFI